MWAYHRASANSLKRQSPLIRYTREGMNRGP